MKKTKMALLGLFVLLSLTAGAFGLAKGDCCDGSACCNGTACCKARRR
jgi:hypothetical protein